MTADSDTQQTVSLADVPTRTIRIPDPDGGADIPIRFQFIEAGSFRMGQRGGGPSEEPVHQVTIADDFLLGTFPVTQKQYRAMASACLDRLAKIERNLGVDPSYFKGDDRPVEQVSWDDACCICQWLTHSGLLPEGWKADLPNEAQWEYACRAGTETNYYLGDRESDLAEVGWYGGNALGETHVVGQKKPNRRGLYDMHGNVWEWCLDYHDPRRYRKQLEHSVVESLMDSNNIEFDPPNPVAVALAEMLGRFAAGNFEVKSGDQQHLQSYLKFSEQRVENGDLQWKDDIAPIKFAIHRGHWPENDKARGLAGATQAVFQRMVDASSRDLPARVLRGGAWDSTAADCRSAYRNWYSPGNRSGICGFRLALVPRVR